MQLDQDRKILKKASLWLIKLKATAPNSDEAALLRELIAMADKSVETSFGTLYPTKSIYSNIPGININLVNKEHGYMMLGFIGESRELKEITSMYRAGKNDESKNTLVSDEILAKRKQLLDESDIPL